MGPDDAFPSFSEFIASVRHIGYEEVRKLPTSRVQESEHFEAMREHILDMYEGVDAQHTFVDTNGLIFDCIPIEQQPSLRGRELAEAPDAPPAHRRHFLSDIDVHVKPHLHPEKADRFGNSMVCPPGCIPMRRITLLEMTRYENLRSFFRKTPRRGLTGKGAERPDDVSNHRYARAIQEVDNLGGNAVMNLWKPSVGSGEFSLSQQWYVTSEPHQTVELGWQVYPGKWNTNNPALFIYWTADDYKKTGSYNLEGKGFVQTNNSWTLGGSLGPLSTYGGAQYILEMGAYLYQGNWWIYLAGRTAADTLGYYPASLYGNGGMSTHASYAKYGGETVKGDSCPPMGSGHFAKEGWQKSAYIRDVDYFPVAGFRVHDSLTAEEPSPKCYTSDVHKTSAPWNEYFFFGGPGGDSCD